MKHVMSPPLRDKRNLSALWGALNTGLIDSVGTDHCPFDTSQKLLGQGDFTKIPNGIPGIEDRVNLMYTYGVRRGRLDLHRFVDALSTRPAKLFGLFPRKGTIAVGSDADSSSTIQIIAARFPRAGSTATTITAASRALLSKAGRPW